MLKLHLIQAEYGDCFLLEFGNSDERHYILIDGGPELVYERHLGPELRRLVSSPGVLDLVILSHVDNDHIVGLLDFLTDVRDHPSGTGGFQPEIKEIWHNTFKRAEGDQDVPARLETLMALGAAQSVMPAASFELDGIGEGEALDRLAELLHIPVNTGFANQLICVDDAPDSRNIANLSLRIVGPTRANLEELKTDWQTWLDENESDIGSADLYLLANRDRSVPNLSSIMILAEANGKRILFTGDGRSDHLLQGLEAARLLDDVGCMHVDLLKVAHHGSDRNATKAFFHRVTADQYVISANGKDGNPDLATLIWIVEAASVAQRQIAIVLTNETPSTRKLLDEYPPADFGYSFLIIPSAADSMAITLG